MKRLSIATASTALIALATLAGSVKPASAAALQFNFSDGEELGGHLLASVSPDDPTLNSLNLLLNSQGLSSGLNTSSVSPALLDSLMSLFAPFIKLGTPGNDIIVGELPTDILLGRIGNDRFIGINPGAANPGQDQIDIFIGGEVAALFGNPTSTAGPNNNLFILGDDKKPYYAGNTGNLGAGDFAFILDFHPSQDFIQLHGFQNDYSLATVNVPAVGQIGTAIFRNSPSPDLIALLLGTFSLSLDGGYFNYDNTPPLNQTLPGFNQLGTAGVDQAFDLATDSAGNTYITGFTQGDLGGASAGQNDAWLAKYDSNGNQLWAQLLGTSSSENAFGIATDSADNIYITGFTKGDLGAPNAGGRDAYLAKYDSNGNQLWVQQLGTSDLDVSNDITVDSADSIYITGFTLSSLGGPNAGEDDPYIAKFDSNGNRLWATQFGSSNYDEPYGITTDIFGNVFTTGWTLGDLGGPNAGLYDAWISKLDSGGNRLWTKQFGSADYEFAWDIATDSFGNVYSTGFTTGDLGGPNAGLYDAFLASFDPSGNQRWIKQFGTAGSDSTFGIDIDSNNTIYLTGYTTGSLGGPNAGGDSVGADDAFWAQFDPDGNLLGINQFGTAGVDRGFGISAKHPDRVYLVGFTDGSLGRLNAGSYDAWLTGRPKSFGPKSVPEPSAVFGLLVLLVSGAVSLPKRKLVNKHAG